MIKFSIPAKKIAIVLGIIAVCLAAASITGQYYKINGGENEFLLKIVEKVDLDQEINNLPTWFQSSLLMLCSFLLTITALIRHEIKDKGIRFWGFLAFIFLYLSLDEAVSIHEQAAVPLRALFHSHGLLFFGWVIPAILLVGLFFVWSLKFLRNLPARVSWLFIIAGVVYVVGALGMEMIGASYYEKFIETHNHIVDLNYTLLTTFEESLEMIGLTIFAFALLDHLGSDAVLEINVKMEKTVETRNRRIDFGKPAAVGFRTK
ncbi:MAG: hypothetical protein ACR2F2_00175 [Pyrinomonadaceae bacterium]